MTTRSWIFVVDDDIAMRDALDTLFRSIGYAVETFGSVEEFTRRERPAGPSCLVLDVRLPGASGIEFQRELAAAAAPIPVVFITGHGDIPMSVSAMRAGAIEFLAKPFRTPDLLDAVSRALEADRTARAEREQINSLRSRFASLSPREREVMALVTSGLLGKQIAHSLQLSEITVKVHRASVMRKMAARSLAELVRMADGLGLRPNS